MLEQIGQTAGEIYSYLEGNGGESTLAKMKKKVDTGVVDYALGWLAREDKIDMWKKGASVNIKLK